MEARGAAVGLGGVGGVGLLAGWGLSWWRVGWLVDGVGAVACEVKVECSVCTVGKVCTLLGRDLLLSGICPQSLISASISFAIKYPTSYKKLHFVQMPRMERNRI